MSDTKTKQPADVLDYDVPFARWFPATDTITTATAIVEPDGAMSVDAVQIDGLTVKVWASGGAHGATYKISVTAATAGGRIKQTEFKIRVRDN